MGAQLRVYKQKISSAQTTKKITKAMELIAASRIQKAMARVKASSPFARAVTRAVSAVATHSNVDHPLTREPEKISRSAVVIFSSDRGLAGAFNSQILREGLEVAELLREQGKEPVFYLVGRKAVGYFQFRGIASAAAGRGASPSRASSVVRAVALAAAPALSCTSICSPTTSLIIRLVCRIAVGADLAHCAAISAARTHKMSAGATS